MQVDKQLIQARNRDQLAPASGLDRGHGRDQLGRSRESVRLLAAGERGPGDFPAPVSHLKARTRLWRWSEVAGWAKSHDQPIDLSAATAIAAINAALTLRQTLGELAPTERNLVSSLL
jgi:hypothetical protein